MDTPNTTVSQPSRISIDELRLKGHTKKMLGMLNEQCKRSIETLQYEPDGEEAVNDNHPHPFSKKDRYDKTWREDFFTFKKSQAFAAIPDSNAPETMQGIAASQAFTFPVKLLSDISTVLSGHIPSTPLGEELTAQCGILNNQIKRLEDTVNGYASTLLYTYIEGLNNPGMVSGSHNKLTHCPGALLTTPSPVNFAKVHDVLAPIIIDQITQLKKQVGAFSENMNAFPVARKVYAIYGELLDTIGDTLDKTHALATQTPETAQSTGQGR